jgi:hypothetical protein
MAAHRQTIKKLYELNSPVPCNEKALGYQVDGDIPLTEADATAYQVDQHPLI